MGGGILKNNNIVSSQNNDGLDFAKTLQNQKNIKNQNILKDINISTNQNTLKNIEISKILKPLKYINFFAFSLIELSIVLIIIGLLVAGVTGGKSLIESARIRAFINELNSYKQATYSSIAINNRLPGDLNNDGYSGPCVVKNGNWSLKCSAEVYSTSSFSAPYDTASTKPNSYSGPFVDLYLEKIIDFAPDKDNINVAGKGYPYSKIFKDGYFALTSFSDNYINPDGASLNNCWINNSNAGNYALLLEMPEVASKEIKAKTVKKIDEKIDDGIYNSGSMRGKCGVGRSDYNLNSLCNNIVYKIK